MNEEMNDWVRTKWGDIFVRVRRDNRRGWEVCCGLYRANKHLIKSNQITRKYERKVSLRDKVQTTIWKLYQHYTSSVWRVHQSTSSEITQSSHCIWYRRPVNWIIFIKVKNLVPIKVIYFGNEKINSLKENENESN